MQHPSAFVAVCAFAGALSAQVNPFVLYPQDPERQAVTCTSFVGRPDVNRAAEALVKFDASWCRALADNSNLLWTHLFGIYHWVADEKLSTVETYGLVVRGEDQLTGLPLTTVSYLDITGLTTPPSSNPNRGTWIMYDGFNLSGGLSTAPIAQAPLYVGVTLPANPLWPATDGHSLFRADMLSANTGATVGENHHSRAHQPTWAVPATGTPFPTPWSYILGPFVVSPNLHMGGVDPTSNRLGAPGANFGLGGIYPDITSPRSDGLVARFTDNLAPFGVVAIGASLGFRGPHFYTYPTPTGWTTIYGASYIGSGPDTIPLLVSTLQNGVRETTVAMPGQIPPALVGTTLAFQGFVWDPNTDLSNWSNAQAVHF
jgi:hypothetical protein